MRSSQILRIIILVTLIIPTLIGSNSIQPQLVSATQQPGINQAIPRILEHSSTKIVIELNTPKYNIEDYVGESLVCQLIETEGYARTDQPGLPEIPVSGFMLGIPAGAVPRITIQQTETKIHPQLVQVCPVSQPVGDSDLNGRSEYAGSQRIQDPEAYQLNALYPAAAIELSTLGMIRSQHVAQFRYAPFQYNPTTGELQVIERLVVEIELNQDSGSEAVSNLPAGFIDEGSFEPVLQDLLLNYETAKEWRTAPSVEGLPAAPEALAASDTYKILVDQDGIYKLTYQALSDAGLPVGSLDPNTLKIHNQGTEVAIYFAGNTDTTFSSNEYLLFYGEQVDSIYTHTNVYWLTWGGENGSRMEVLDGSIDGTNVPLDFMSSQVVEENQYYQSSRPSGPDNDRWYWDYIYASAATSKTFTTSLQHISTESHNITVRGFLHGHSSTPQNHTQIYLNGNLIEGTDSYWASTAPYSFGASVPQSYLVEGTNEITVQTVFDSGITLQFFWINRFEIDYYDTYAAEGDILTFKGELNGQPQREWNYQVNNFSGNEIYVFDITNPLSPASIENTQVNDMGGSYQLSFERTIDQDSRYIALTPAQFLPPAPEDIILDSPSSLKDTSNGADYILITHPDFILQAQDLNNHRAAQGYRTGLVELQDIFDEFNGGVYDTQAIHDFLAYAYSSWTPPSPQFVLLMGDGHYDFFDYQGFGQPNFIPPYLADVDPVKGETATDNRFVTVSGPDILPDMHLGRLPAQTPADAQIMVDKIINYEINPPADDWYKKVTFVADNKDDAGDFAALSDDIADNYLPSTYTKAKVYFKVNGTTEADVRNGIITAFNQGRLIINYIGHAAVPSWGHELYFKVEDVASLTNTDRFPLMLPMTCLEGTYQHPDPGYQGLSETLVRDNNGAVGSWAPTGYGVATGHDFLEKGLFTDLFANNNTLVGPATTYAKYYLAGVGYYLDLIDTYVLLGDPALNLKAIQQSSLELNPGWNLIALPVQTMTGYNAQSILDEINNQGGACSEINRWSGGGWEAHTNGSGSNIFTIQPGAGYFIRCTSSSEWTIDGFDFNMGLEISLNSGWNLVGIPYPRSHYQAQSLLQDISDQGGACSELNRWHNNGWDSHINGLPFNNFILLGDAGYFTFCSQMSNFSPGN